MISATFCLVLAQRFGGQLIRLIHHEGRAVPAHFFHPLICLMGLDATLREAGITGIDFQRLAAPYCLEAVLRGGNSK